VHSNVYDVPMALSVSELAAEGAYLPIPCGITDGRVCSQNLPDPMPDIDSTSPRWSMDCASSRALSGSGCGCGRFANWEVRDRGVCPCGHAEEPVRQRVLELDAEIADLRRIRKQLVELCCSTARRGGAIRSGVAMRGGIHSRSRGGEDDGGP
jgi:hypothetical protein